MLTSPSAHSLLPRLSWALLLLATFLSMWCEVWDQPTCTRGVLQASQGERAVMTCNISNNFTRVNICKYINENSCLHVLSVDAPGTTTQDGWLLWVQGGMAELVTEDAQATQTGEYRWQLQGRQTNLCSTKLNVSVWERPTCTRQVSVSRGERAVMTCSTSNTFTHVDVFLCTNRSSCQHVLGVDAPGTTAQSGWHLQVQGGAAELVTEDAQTTQAGEYRWHLKGPQLNPQAPPSSTKLNVSALMMPATVESLMQPKSKVVAPILLLFLVLLLLGLIAWHQRQRFQMNPFRLSNY